MQVDRGFLKIAMTQQHLDGSKIGASFEHMSGKAVPQGMGMNVFVLEAGALGGLLAGAPENLGGDRVTRRMPPVSGKQPVGGLAPKPAPVGAQRFKQLRAEHDIPILATLAATDMNDHALAVDIADFQVRSLCAARARGIKCHEQNAVKGKLCRVNQTRDLLLAEYLRKVKHFLRIGCFRNAPVPLQYVDVEKA